MKAYRVSHLMAISITLFMFTGEFFNSRKKQLQKCFKVFFKWWLLNEIDANTVVHLDKIINLKMHSTVQFQGKGKRWFFNGQFLTANETTKMSNVSHERTTYRKMKETIGKI